MAKETFATIMPLVFETEGGYVDHPDDPGRATKYGITHATLASVRGRSVTKADVKALTKDQAEEIFYHRYWTRVHGDDLPAGVDYAVFDFAVNSGPSRAVKYLQRVVNVTEDGIVGPITLGAVQAQNNPNHVINALCDARMAYLKRLRHWTTFGDGWTRRVSKVRQEALGLATGALPQFRVPDTAPEPDRALRAGNWLVKAIMVLIALGAAVAAYLGLR